MIEQIDVFDEAIRHTHTGDPVTSYSAIEKLIESGELNRQQAIVYNAWKTYPDTTAQELSELLGLDYHMIQRRKSDLLNKKVLIETEKRRGGQMVMRVI